ncbi:hypothetical protein CLU79DRAFT_724171 [Phycomyces nitens]|nr:hypothetical protein CLU79DRAFT_724171 [Phycomyces nitens]
MPTADALSVLSAIPLTDDTIICGDLNARLGSLTGNRPPRPSKWKKFWTPALQEAADHCDGCYKQWRRACGIDKINWWSRHQRAHLEFRQAFRPPNALPGTPSVRLWRETLAKLPPKSNS